MDITQKQCHGVLFYSCDAMTAAGFSNGFSTRVGGVSPPPWDTLNLGAGCGDQPHRVGENFRRFCTAVGTDAQKLVKNKQVHGDLVRPVTGGDCLSAPELPGTAEADGLVTGEKGICLTVFSADCIPILLCDPRRRVAAAVHAGWRGTALGIAARVVEHMVECCGCRAQDILAAIGPGISTCCFETRSDVPEGFWRHMGRRAERWIHPGADEEHFFVDLKGANAGWLTEAGVIRDHIAICPACTACETETFWSHRRLGTSRGSMAAMIQMN